MPLYNAVLHVKFTRTKEVNPTFRRGKTLAHFSKECMLTSHWQGHRFVVFVDSFSKWVDIQYLKDLSAASLANTLRRIFKYVGLPTTLISDNGTNFTSKEFLKYLLDNYVHHVFTPPGHHASNGQVERVIQELDTFK